MSFTTPSARWRAVIRRDPLTASSSSSSSSSFVYCVTTTHIYCRPTCPSRLARRANVIFHDTAADAEAAGFRACKRCRPEEQHSPQTSVVEKVCRIIRESSSKVGEEKEEEEEEEVIKVKDLAERVGLTESYLHRIFRRQVGCTPGEYRLRYRRGVEETVEETMVVDVDVDVDVDGGGGGGGGGEGTERTTTTFEVDDHDPLAELELWMLNACAADAVSRTPLENGTFDRFLEASDCGILGDVQLDEAHVENMGGFAFSPDPGI